MLMNGCVRQRRVNISETMRHRVQATDRVCTNEHNKIEQRRESSRKKRHTKMRNSSAAMKLT